MKAIILTAEGVEDVEFFYPYYRFMEEGIETDVATPGGKQVQGKHGYHIPADMDFNQVQSNEYDILYLPGGRGPETVRLDPKALEITREMFNAGKIVCAICHGFQIIISAGLAQGKSATCWSGIKDDLIAAGANFHDKSVVVDGNLITSRQPNDLPAFSREIFEAVRAGV